MTSESKYEIRFVSSSNAGAAMLAKHGVAACSPRPKAASASLPIAASRSQAYYWKRSWQAAEGEALAEIQAGQARTFPSAEAAIRYLLSPDDE